MEKSLDGVRKYKYICENLYRQTSYWFLHYAHTTTTTAMIIIIIVIITMWQKLEKAKCMYRIETTCFHAKSH